MAQFETNRLICRSLSLDEYSHFESGNEPMWIGCSNPYRHLVDGNSPLRHRIPRVRKNESFAEIGLFLAILKDSQEIIGSAGFHDFPDDRGMIEIGYEIVGDKQNQGFGTELLHGMWNFICQSPAVKVLRYTVSPENYPSLHIIQKLNFKLTGEQIDPEDGIELIYEKTREEYLASK